MQMIVRLFLILVALAVFTTVGVYLFSFFALAFMPH
jgi:hypothetical protein